MATSSQSETPETTIDFESFYAEEFRPVLGLAYVLSGDPGSAEDLTQDAFIAALRNWPRVCEFDSPGGWVRRVVARRAVSAIRRRIVAQRRRPIGDTPTVRFGPQTAVETEHIWTAVRSLPARQAQCVALKYLEGYSVAEIATTLGSSENTIKTHLRRANAKLTRKLSEEART